MGMVEIKCDFCGKVIKRYPSQIKKHNFCSKNCLADFSSKTRNPGKYADLKNYKNISAHMSKLNYELNPNRMTLETRTKLSRAGRNRGSGKSYPKVFGRHIQRVLAEKMLGLELKQNEVVHHIDKNKRNNQTRNLMVFESQSEHAKWHAEHDYKGGDAL